MIVLVILSGVDEVIKPLLSDANDIDVILLALAHLYLLMNANGAQRLTRYGIGRGELSLL